MSIEKQLVIKRAIAKGLIVKYGIDPYIMSFEEVNDLINKLMFFKLPLDINNI